MERNVARDSLVSHKEQHGLSECEVDTDTKPLRCDICHETFTDMDSLVSHKEQHGFPEGCEKDTISESNETDRKPELSDMSSTGCDIYNDASFTSQDMVNTDREFFKLKDECDRMEKSYQGEGGQKVFQCDQCDKAFVKNNYLIKHVRRHSRERPFQCDQCNKAFAQKVILIKHLRRHIGEKRLQCDICDKAFVDKGDLTRHIRIHSGEKPFQCDQKLLHKDRFWLHCSQEGEVPGGDLPDGYC